MTIYSSALRPIQKQFIGSLESFNVCSACLAAQFPATSAYHHSVCTYTYTYERRRTAAAADGVGVYTYFQPFDNNSTIGKCGRKSKGKRSIAVRNTPHRYGNGNSHAIWDHTVIPANRQM